MTITQMAAFAAVCEEGSVTKAAERLFIAQPGVSRLIKDLSKQCSFQLFESVGGKLKPTQKAYDLLADVKEILQRIDMLEKKMMGIEDEFVLRIGFNLSSEIGIMLNATKEMERRHPGIRISISEDKSSAFESKLIRGELDFALVIDNTNNPQLSHKALCDKEFIWVCAKGHPLANVKDVSIEQIVSEKIALPYFSGGEDVELSFGDATRTLDPENTWLTTNAFAAMDAVLSGDYISLLPKRTAQRHVDSGSLVSIDTQAPNTPHISAIYFKGKKLTAPMKEFIDIFSELVRTGV